MTMYESRVKEGPSVKVQGYYEEWSEKPKAKRKGIGEEVI